MSIQSLSNSISSADREIISVENQLQTINNNLSRKEKEANIFLERISREKDIKRLISLQKDLARKNDEINTLNKDKSTKTKALYDKQAKRLKLIQELSKAEQKGRETVKKEQKELLSLHQSITEEMEKQKRLSINS